MGTVREDYSHNGTVWDYFTHDQARSRAYRWGEDGIAGISDEQQQLCFAIALWNGEDPILKERFFGLTGSEGNHGEDVKEYYFSLDNTPTHSYIKMLYKYPQKALYIFDVNGLQFRVDYEPAESSIGLFGGNSNWRSPVWFPVNFLLVESLQKFHYYLGDDFKVECPTRSGQMMTLWEVATELSQRLMQIFLRNSSGQRPVYGGTEKFQTDPHWRDLILLYEYFHGDNGAGIGASH